jgi:hypothetical protein
VFVVLISIRQTCTGSEIYEAATDWTGHIFRMERQRMQGQFGDENREKKFTKETSRDTRITLRWM